MKTMYWRRTLALNAQLHFLVGKDCFILNDFEVLANNVEVPHRFPFDGMGIGKTEHFSGRNEPAEDPTVAARITQIQNVQRPTPYQQQSRCNCPQYQHLELQEISPPFARPLRTAANEAAPSAFISEQEPL